MFSSETRIRLLVASLASIALVQFALLPSRNIFLKNEKESTSVQKITNDFLLDRPIIPTITFYERNNSTIQQDNSTYPLFVSKKSKANLNCKLCKIIQEKKECTNMLRIKLKKAKNYTYACRLYMQSLQVEKGITKKQACQEALFVETNNICHLQLCNITYCQTTNEEELPPPPPPLISTKIYNNETKQYSIDVVIKLNGELGNHLLKLASAKALQFVAEEFNYPISFNFHYLGQEHSKSKTPRKEITSCFQDYYHANFKECNTALFKKIQTQQEMFFGKNKKRLSMEESVRVGQAISDIKSMFDFILKSIQAEKFIPFHQLQQIIQSNDNIPMISIPYINADIFCAWDLLDHYYLKFQQAFQFNETCCRSLPNDDETVVHIRGFSTEMPRAGQRAKFRELEPKRMVQYVLGHLQSKEKVVLLSRFDHILKPYVEALKLRNIQVRTMTGQTGIQDFCFLAQSTKETVGMISSTYVFMASLLSKTVKKVILYRTAEYRDATNMYRPSLPFFYDEVLNKTFWFPVYSEQRRLTWSY